MTSGTKFSLGSEIALGPSLLRFFSAETLDFFVCGGTGFFCQECFTFLDKETVVMREKDSSSLLEEKEKQ